MLLAGTLTEIELLLTICSHLCREQFSDIIFT